MSPFVVSIVLVSTVMHAGWNLVARGQRNEIPFFGRMILVIAVVGLVPAGVSELIARSLTPTAWVCLAGSGLSCGVYFFCLARAYGSSDFTVVYPVARAVPVILIGLGDVLRGNPLTPPGWAGMLMVVAGCLLCPLHSFRDLSLRRYLHRSIFYILLTALGTVGYTLCDKVAAETVAQSPATAARYCYFFFVGTLACYAALVRLFCTGKERSGRVGRWPPVLAAVLNYGAYSLVLWAYQMTARAGYIVAFRQFSIVIGVVLAFAMFRERGRAVRLVGASLTTAGLVVIALWGGQ